VSPVFLRLHGISGFFQCAGQVEMRIGKIRVRVNGFDIEQNGILKFALGVTGRTTITGY
jgi:hypothetical protein